MYKPTLLLGAVILALLAGQSVPGQQWPDTVAAQQLQTVEPSSAVVVSVTTTDTAPQIVVQPSYKLGEKIVVEFLGASVADAEASLHWTLPPTVQSESGSSDGRRLLLWAPSGLHDLKLSVSYSLDVLVPDPDSPGKSKIRKLVLPAYTYTAQFKVGDGVPDPVPGPKPDPNVPLTGLAALVPDAVKRHLVSEFYADLSQAVANGAFVTTTHFRNGYRKAIADAQGSGALPKGIAALDPIISGRISVAIGLVPDAALNTQALVSVLNGVSQELSQ